MITDTHIETAINEGIISEQQARQLQELARQEKTSETTPDNEVSSVAEEKFRLISGFGDIFIAIGVLLFCLGLWQFIITLASPIWGAVIVIATLWILAEFLTARFRLTAPSIVLTLCILTSATALVFILNPQPDDVDWFTKLFLPVEFGGSKTVFQYLSQTISWFSFVPATVMAAFYLRFRLPFTLAPLMLCLTTATAIMTTKLQTDLATTHHIYLAGGLLSFIIAMCYDLSDPERTTTNADRAFWLHAIAAPMLVHSIALAGASTLVLIEFCLAIIIIAIIIDRRALIVSSLAYLGAAMSGGIEVAGLDHSLETLVLGLCVISLGVAWRPIRTFLMRLLPDFGYKQYLPPYETTT